ncbi:MAG: hypothetical protein RIR73_2673, partial [Chloroflexota bacterium]
MVAFARAPSRNGYIITLNTFHTQE